MNSSKHCAHRTEPQHQKKSGGSRFIRQLIVSALLFGLWIGAQQFFPQAMKEWGESLSGLLSGSCDLTQACIQLAEDLSDGEDVIVSVGNWCQTVFAPGDGNNGASE